ncbi:FAD:protein FMN transferase [Selenomonas sp. TAMA-11512]|nr:FAD:protein FMN transferase [Selenomonas sp. TAMA-11512]
MSFYAMDTIFHFTVYDGDKAHALKAAREEAERLEALWSVTRAESEISRLNHSEGTPEKVSQETLSALRYAQELYRVTDGVLDVSLFPLLSAWGFTRDTQHVPNDEVIARMLARRGIDALRIEGDTVTMPAGAELDFGAIGKGYAADIVAARLREYGVTSAILSLGGNITVMGKKPDNTPWRVAIKDPSAPERMMGVVDLSEESLATSGGYERFFIENGIRYGHILDPRTGWPAETNLLSATAIAKDGRGADAFSTTLYILGLDGAIDFYLAHEGLDFILVTSAGEVYISEGLDGRFSLLDDYAGKTVNIVIKSG